MSPRANETIPLFRYDMIRQQKYASAAAAKKAAAALRAQLHQELESKKICTYQPHECSQLTLEGYDYCLRHIMEDKSAPYKQCNYVYNNNGKRCHLPAPKGEKKDHAYCADHAFKSHLMRVRAGSKHQPSDSIETMLDSLSHYVVSDESKSTIVKKELIDDKDEDTEDLITTPCLDPFTDINAAAVNSSRSRVLDYGSDSESDVEAACYTSVYHDAHADSSDDESIDSEQEDVLKHAGIYTAEEVTLVTRDKLIRLQSLYIEQFKHLQHVLKERRRKYLHALKKEKETLASIHSQPRDTPKEQRMYSKLKAFNHYHKKHGIDAIMNKKFTELRAKLTDGATVKQQPFTKCTFVEDGVKCLERALPVAKHCRKHIMHDTQQVLFKRCSRVEADIECNEPALAIFKEPSCRYHADFPSLRNYGETRTFEDSDMEDSSDAHDQQHMDIMASSSCDSKTPATITSSQAMSFANQFPVQPKLEMYESESGHPLLIAGAPTDEEYIKMEIDVASIDETVSYETYSVKEESNSSIPVQSRLEEEYKLDEDADLDGKVVDLDNSETVDTELSAIDPDDDMAGIMFELQKDKMNLPSAKEDSAQDE
ncbi:dim gamma-tubulin 1 [Carabus blaptoides fortunei]